MKRTSLTRRTRINPKRSKPRRKGPPARQVAVKVMPDGREICSGTEAGRREYERRKIQMWELDDHLCCVCDREITDVRLLTFEHWDGRGMGGAKQDDRIHDGARRINGVSHFRCNVAKGSKKLEVYRAELGLPPRDFRMPE